MNSEVREIMLRLCRSKTYNDYVFVSPKTGGRLTDVKKRFSKGVLDSGFDAFTIAALLGHSNVRTTQRYVRATERNKREAVQAAVLDAPGHNLATRVYARPQKQAVA